MHISLLWLRFLQVHPRVIVKKYEGWCEDLSLVLSGTGQSRQRRTQGRCNCTLRDLRKWSLRDAILHLHSKPFLNKPAGMRSRAERKVIYGSWLWGQENHWVIWNTMKLCWLFYIGEKIESNGRFHVERRGWHVATRIPRRPCTLHTLTSPESSGQGRMPGGLPSTEHLSQFSDILLYSTVLFCSTMPLVTLPAGGWLCIWAILFVFAIQLF